MPCFCGFETLSRWDVGDGTVFKLKVTQDVALKREWNNNDKKLLLVGKPFSTNKTRSLIQFQTITSKDCSDTKVRWAKMYLYFYEYHKHHRVKTIPPFPERPLQVHMVWKEWKEDEATPIERMNGVKWGKPWLDLENVDAWAHSLDEPKRIYVERPKGFVEFDVTVAVQKWIKYGGNYGLLIWATDESIAGRDLRFISNYERGGKRHAFVNVMCDY